MKVLNKITVIQLYFMFDNLNYDSIVRIINQRDQILYEGIYGETELFDERKIDNFSINEHGEIEIVIY